MSEAMSSEAFRKLAEDTYGADRFAPPEAIERLIETAREQNREHPWQEEAGREYLEQAVLPLGNACVCGENLMGLLGTFEWGIQHGIGRCSRCGAGYRLYHYIGEKPETFAQFRELISIPKEAVQEEPEAARSAGA